MSTIVSNNLLLKVTKPSRYMGGEINSIVKKWTSHSIKVALIFPEPYEIGMSHLGYQILYSLLNSQENIICERAFMPWTDMMELMKTKKIPLFSIETRKPIREFDIVGFSLQHELSFTNVLSILALAGIPYLAKKRQGTSPLIVGGGPCTFNPEPLAPFFDAFFVGEAEEAIFEMVQAFRIFRDSQAKSKESLLEKLTRIEGFYVPSFFEPKLDRESGHFIPKPLKPGYEKVKRRVLSELSINSLPSKPVVPFMRTVHDRVNVEIQRGCTKGCRFCQAGMIYRPTRQRQASQILDYSIKTQKNTGYENISFLSLNPPDHPRINSIFSNLSKKYSASSVALSLPSTRIDEFNEEVMKEILSLRKTGFTFAPEAGSERLRRSINKPITDDEILENLEKIYKSGWNLVKLYFMVGLPTETPDDIKAIGSLTKTVARTARKISKRNGINVNISPFVPKPHTPYQWVGQDSLANLEGKIACLKKELKYPAINIKWHDPRASMLEALFARGDRRLADMLLERSEEGSFDAWSDMFDYAAWLKAMKSAGITTATATTAIDTGCPLPWDFIDTGITKEFLISELRKTYSGKTSTDCAFAPCNQCGVCDENLKPVIDESPPVKASNATKDDNCHRTYIPTLITFKKEGRAKLISHLELVKVFERAFKRCGIELKISQGFHPIPLMTFSRALPIGVESEDERLGVHLGSKQKFIDIDLLNSNLPQGLTALEASHVSSNNLATKLNPKNISYIARTSGEIQTADLERAVQSFKNTAQFPIIKKTKKGTREIDLKDIITEIDASTDHIHLTFDETKTNVNPLTAIDKIIGKEGFAKNLEIRKIKAHHGN